MSTDAHARHEAVSAMYSDAENKLAALRSQLADAGAREQAALVAADFAAADKARAECAQLTAQLPAAEAAFDSLRAARMTTAAEVTRAQHLSQRDQLQDAVDATREQLRTMLEDAVAAVETAQAKLRQAEQLEQSFAALQRELHAVRVALGEVEYMRYPVKEQPASNLLNGTHMVVLTTVRDADLKGLV